MDQFVLHIQYHADDLVTRTIWDHWKDKKSYEALYNNINDSTTEMLLYSMLHFIIKQISTASLYGYLPNVV